MQIDCPNRGACARSLRVTLAKGKPIYEEISGLKMLADTCPRERISGAVCAAAERAHALRAQITPILEVEELEA